jgi:hypothetical protein
MPLEYGHFPPGFMGDSDIMHTVFFDKLFPDPQIDGRPIRIVSVFPKTPPIDVINKKYCWVSYSGEAYSQPSRLYDVNLIMEETDHANRIVCTTLFAVQCIVDDLWKPLQQPRMLNRKSKFCALTSSNPRAYVRHGFADLLSKYKRVDSMGSARNNCNGFMLPRGSDGATILKDYKFIICFENTLGKPCYLTEKLLNAYIHGAIPIYAGAVKALTWLNPDAFLYLEDSTPAAMSRLIEKIKLLDQNDDAYVAMFNQPLLRDYKIPRELTIDHIKEQLDAILSQRQDAAYKKL